MRLYVQAKILYTRWNGFKAHKIYTKITQNYNMCIKDVLKLLFEALFMFNLVPNEII